MLTKNLIIKFVYKKHCVDIELFFKSGNKRLLKHKHNIRFSVIWSFAYII